MDVPQRAPLVYVSFSAEINPTTTENLINAMGGLANKEVQEVYLFLSTPGGDIQCGMNLYNMLKGMPFELTTHNTSNVSSVGITVFLAGKKRYATPNATFMFHGVGFTLSQNQRLEERLLREKLNGVLTEQKRIGDIITQNTKIPADEVAKLFKQAQTKDASWAIDKGIIHEIRDAQLATGCPVISFIFKR